MFTSRLNRLVGLWRKLRKLENRWWVSRMRCIVLLIRRVTWSRCASNRCYLMKCFRFANCRTCPLEMYALLVRGLICGLILSNRVSLIGKLVKLFTGFPRRDRLM